MSFYRQLLVFTVPSVAVLFGIYWYRRKRIGNCDPGGNIKNLKSLKEEFEEALAASEAKAKRNNSKVSSPARIITKSAPIDIVPNGMSSQRSLPVGISDKELDIELEKIKSQRLYEMEMPLKLTKENTPPMLNKRPKSLPAKSTTPSPNKVTQRNQLKTSNSVKQEINVSCLSEQLANSKISENSSNSTNNTLSDLTIEPIAEEIKVESIIPLDVSNVKVENSEIKEMKNNPESTVLKENVEPQVISISNVTVKDKQEHTNLVEKSSKSDKSTKNSKKSKKQSSVIEKKLGNNDKKNTSSGKRQPLVAENLNKIEKTDKVVTRVDMVPNQDKSSKEKENTQTTVTESTQNRDSANHSPFDAMLASPSNGHFSDNHSEGSNDSGKGCSESPSPPPSAGDMNQSSNYICHQFIIPKYATGILIGAKKTFLQKLNSTTGAVVRIKEYLESPKFNICCVEGSQQDIDIILDMIKQRLPEKKFPNISYKDMTAELCKMEYSILAECYNLNLVEGVNNDAIISCYVSPSQLFLQQPMHPTYPHLHILHSLMGACYQNPTVPSLPSTVKEGMICAAPTANNWYRTQIVATNPENNTSIVKLVDFGGFMDISNTLLKQIHGDFMTLPFQATEVQLAHVAPIDKEDWSSEAVQVIAGLTSGQMLQAQVVGYNDDGLPQVYLYLTLGPQQVISLNQELVVRGLAQWVEEEC